jgi:hypothetical protein
MATIRIAEAATGRDAVRPVVAARTAMSPSARRFAIVVLVAFAARAITFGDPIVHVDESFYLAAAHAWAHGALPYVDVWDRKPIGLFLLYLPAGAAAPEAGVWIYQAEAFAAAVATALVIARLADRIGWAAGATMAAALYLLWLDLGDGEGGQSPVFYNLPMALAALLTLVATAGDRVRRGPAIGAMLLVGMALQIKYAAIFEGGWFGGWLLWADWRRERTRTIGLAFALTVATVLPTALAALAYAAIGEAPAFLFANFRSILDRGQDPPLEQLHNAFVAFSILGPPSALAIAGARAPGEAAARTFAIGWAIVALIGFVGFGSWFNHYTLPVLAPFAVCSAGAFALVPRLRRGAPLVAALFFVAAQATLISERHIRGSPAEFARIVKAIGRGPGSLFVYSGSSAFYSFTGRPSLTRYLFADHLQEARENGAVGVSQRGEIARVLARRPAVVVVQSLDGGERPDLHAAVLGWLIGHRYRRVGPLPLGDRRIEIFRAP